MYYIQKNDSYLQKVKGQNLWICNTNIAVDYASKFSNIEDAEQQAVSLLQGEEKRMKYLTICVLGRREGNPFATLILVKRVYRDGHVEELSK